MIGQGKGIEQSQAFFRAGCRANGDRKIGIGQEGGIGRESHDTVIFPGELTGKPGLTAEGAFYRRTVHILVEIQGNRFR